MLHKSCADLCGMDSRAGVDWKGKFRFQQKQAGTCNCKIVVEKTFPNGSPVEGLQADHEKCGERSLRCKSSKMNEGRQLVPQLPLYQYHSADLRECQEQLSERVPPGNVAGTFWEKDISVKSRQRKVLNAAIICLLCLQAEWFIVSIRRMAGEIGILPAARIVLRIFIQRYA